MTQSCPTPATLGGDPRSGFPMSMAAYADVRPLPDADRYPPDGAVEDETDRIRDALRFIDATDRTTWVKMAMAVKSSLGDAGFAVWEDWSRSADSFDAKEAVRLWQTIDMDGAVTVATLYYEARMQGWRTSARRMLLTRLAGDNRHQPQVDQQVKRDVASASERAATAANASEILAQAGEASPDHPYLVRKQVTRVAHLREIDTDKVTEILGYAPTSGGRRLSGRLLVAPVSQGEMISTVELIDEDGLKTALAGRGTKRGGFWATDPLPDGDGDGLTLIIGEGVATTISARDATDHPGIAALSSGNLTTVAMSMRDRYPMATIVMLADLDKTTGSPDRHAIEAARAVRGKLAIPSFGPGMDLELTDFNDMAKLTGREAVANAIASATWGDCVELAPPAAKPVAAERANEVHLVRACDLAPEPVEWLWNGWLAAGKLHVFGGAPGTGKTTISMALAAAVSTGGRWPDGSRAPHGNVVIWSGEDDPADTLNPRLILSGADRDRVFFIAETSERRTRRSFDPSRDLHLLQQKLTEIGEVRLLIIDPLVSAISGDSHKNAEVRRGLQPLVDLAASMKCALLGITHFSKGTGGRDPVERLTGSLAFGALARVVMIAAKRQGDATGVDNVRLLCRAKSNIGPDDGGFEYDLREAPLDTNPSIVASSVVWGRALAGSARDLLAEAETPRDDGSGSSFSGAKRFLADLLSAGPMLAGDVIDAAERAGFSKRSIQRAATSIRVDRQKDGMKGGWDWRLPTTAPRLTEDAEDARIEPLAPLAPSIEVTETAIGS